MAPRIDAAKLSDQGRVREQNEDCCEFRVPDAGPVRDARGALLVVADGMGGHDAGQVASQWATAILVDRYYNSTASTVQDALREALAAANAEVRALAAREDWDRSGTTMVCAVIRGSTLTIAHVGDSRAYLVRGGEIRQLTEDHTWVLDQVKAGLMTPEQAAENSHGNVITRAVGTQPEVDFDFSEHWLAEGDAVVLCTDGLTGSTFGPSPVPPGEIAAIVSAAESPAKAARQLVDVANQRGGPDNITTIVAFYRRPPRASIVPPTARHLAFGSLAAVALVSLGFGAFNLIGRSTVGMVPLTPFPTSLTATPGISASLHADAFSPTPALPATQTPTRLPTQTREATPSPTTIPTATATPTATRTPLKPSPTATRKPPTPTHTATTRPTNTVPPTSTATTTATATTVPTSTPTPTSTPQPPQPAPTATPVPPTPVPQPTSWR